MKNFYFVTTLNLTNIQVKSMLERQGVFSMVDTMIDFKLRSKLFMSYSEANAGAIEDFDKKLKLIFTDKEVHEINHFSVINPAFASQSADAMEELIRRLGSKAMGEWDENCCNVLFFAANSQVREPNQDSKIDPNSWMFKYEIFYTEDAMELSGNGDIIFSEMNVPHTEFTSTYH